MWRFKIEAQPIGADADWFVVARNDRGEAYAHNYCRRDKNAINRLCVKIMSKVAREKNWTPDPKYWTKRG
jgi:hypothetical protein